MFSDRARDEHGHQRINVAASCVFGLIDLPTFLPLTGAWAGVKKTWLPSRTTANQRRLEASVCARDKTTNIHRTIM